MSCTGAPHEEFAVMVRESRDLLATNTELLAEISIVKSLLHDLVGLLQKGGVAAHVAPAPAGGSGESCLLPPDPAKYELALSRARAHLDFSALNEYLTKYKVPLSGRTGPIERKLPRRRTQ